MRWLSDPSFRSSAYSQGSDIPTFAVLAHTDPPMLARLVANLRPDPVIVHVDLRSERGPFERAVAEYSHVHLLDPQSSIAVHWAAWSGVQAMTALAEHALPVTAAEDHVVFLSGQDYLLRPVSEFREYLRAAPFRQHTRLVDARTRPDTFDLHFADRHFQDAALFPDATRWGRLDRVNLALRTALRVAARPLHRVPRPADLVPALGSNWTALTPDCLSYLRSAMTPERERYFRRIWAPDERAWQSVLANSPYLLQTPAGALETWDPQSWPKNFHHVNESLSGFFTDGADELRATGKFFVRKVHSAHSRVLLDELDRRISTTATAGTS